MRAGHWAVGAGAVVTAVLVGTVVLLDRSPSVVPVGAASGLTSTPDAPPGSPPSASGPDSADPPVGTEPVRMGAAPPSARGGVPAPAASQPSRPTPTKKPAPDVGPEPPPPAAEPLPEGTCPHYDGDNASTAAVESALDTAAGRAFWTVSQVRLPRNLIKAVAWQESGWQSAIIACDGGIGTMQVMPNTADWMNNRFDTAHDVRTLAGNTMLGSAFLQWLIKYFGDVYFDGDYEIRAADCQRDLDVPDHREWCLLNAVISAYNFGHGAVDARVAQGDGIYFPNHQYVENVRALMGRY